MPGRTRSGDAKAASLAVTKTSEPSGVFRTGMLAWVSVLLLACLAVRAGEALNLYFNPDEFQFFHSAWMVGHGYLPHRDFWTNYPPLFIHLLRPLVAHYDGDASTLFAVARLLIWIVNLGLFGLVAAFASLQGSWLAGLFAALLLSVNATAFSATVAVRHDSLALICELLALALLARGVRSGRSRDALAAGAGLGLALAMTPKALFGLSGLVLGCLVYEVCSASGAERRPGLMRAFRLLAALLVGTLGALGLIVASLLPFDLWRLMIKQVFLENLGSPDRFSPLGEYLLREIRAEPIAWLVMLIGFGVAARQWWAGSRRRDATETLLLVAGLWFGVTYLFLMASPYNQSALPFIAVLSMFGGRLLATGAAYLDGASSSVKKTAGMISLVLIVSWIPLGSAWSVLPEDPPFRRMNAPYLRTIQYVLSLTGPGDAVFDGDTAYIFRPQASYYGNLIKAILLRIQRGELDFDIPERCERLGCKVIIADPRVALLPESVQAWIRNNYIRSPAFPHVLLHRSLASSLRSSQ